MMQQPPKEDLSIWEYGELMEAGMERGPLWLGESYLWHVERLEQFAIDTLPKGFPRFESPSGVALVVALIMFDRECEHNNAQDKIDLLQSDIRRYKAEILALTERREQLSSHGLGRDLRNGGDK
jgi:hypothetical protein